MLTQKIIEDLKGAMKNREQEKVGVLRMMQAEIKNEEIKLMKREDGISDEEAVAVLQRMVKQRNDAKAQYESGARPDLAAKEKSEVEVISAYLPAQLPDDELKKIIQETIAAVGAASAGDIGKVMGAVMQKVRGRADGNRVRAIAQQLLAS